MKLTLLLGGLVLFLAVIGYWGFTVTAPLAEADGGAAPLIALGAAGAAAVLIALFIYIMTRRR